MSEITPEEVQQLVESLKSLDMEDTPRFGDFVSELTSMGECSPDLLETLLAHFHFAVRAVATAALGRLNPPDALPRLLNMAKDHNSRVKARALEALPAVCDPASPPPEVVDLVLKAIEDKEDLVRAAGTTALGQLELPERFEKLSVLVKDQSWDVKRAAGRSLGNTGRLEAVGLAVSLLDVENDNLDWNCGDSLDTLPLKFSSEELLPLLQALPAKNRRTALSTLGQYPHRPGPNLIRNLLADIEKEEVDVTRLASYGMVLPEENQDEGPEPQTLFRDEELEACLERLKRPGNRSLVLLGPSGCGKTAVLQQLARHLQIKRGGRGPWYILRTSTSELMTGTRYIGEWETKLSSLLAEIKRPKPVILYLTNINEILGAGTSSTSDASFFSFLSPLIESGEVVVIGESTPEAWQRGLGAHPMGRRLFRTIKLEAMHRSRTRDLLRAIVARHAEYLQTKEQRRLLVDDTVLDRLIHLTEGFFQGTALPGKAVELLREVLAARQSQAGDVTIDGTEVIVALTRITGLPARLLDDRVALDLEEVRRFFTARILGQEEAVESIVDLITLIKAGLNDPEKPFGVFFFVGPTGVGKTEIAKALAEYIFGAPDRMIRVDMSEYKDYHSFEKLIGTPGPARVQHGGFLTARVQENPFSVILLDEFEKAHPNIFDLFLQVFDDGRLTDAQGTTVNFRNTIVIMTSNLASEWDNSGRLGFIETLGGYSRTKVLTQMEKFFRPEFLNRIGRTVVFRALGPETMRRIASRELGRALQRWGLVRRKLLPDVGQSLINLLVREGTSLRFGARPLKRKLEELVLLPMARELLKVSTESSGAILRLYARGNRTHLRVVAGERRARRTDLGLPSAEKLLARFEQLSSALARDGLGERRRELQQKVQASNFYDLPQARELLAELRWLERLESGLKQLGEAVTTLHSGESVATMSGAMAEGGQSPLVRSLERLELLWRTREPQGRAGAWLSLRRLDPPGEADRVLEPVVDCWKRFAEVWRLGLEVVHERVSPEGALMEVLLRVDGPGVAALLAGEGGVQSWEREGHDGPGYLRVEVVPALGDVGWKPDAQELFFRTYPAPDRTPRLMPTYRTHLEAIHVPTMLDAEVCGPLGEEETRRQVLEYLAAQVRLHAALERGKEGLFDPERPSSPVRHWVLLKEPSEEEAARLLEALEAGIDGSVRGRLEATD